MKGRSVLKTSILLCLSLSCPSLLLGNSFPVSGIVSDQVYFWKKIFGQYTSKEVLIHDIDNPRLIIDVVDTGNLPPLVGTERLSPDQKKNVILKAYIQRYEKGLSRFQDYGPQEAISYGKIEKRLKAIYSQDKEGWKRLISGKARIRSQSGLRDQFAFAAQQASYYMPFMEKTFSEKKIPPRITRLPFVESMFNLKAISKVGASGIWQFMPGTAKSYMHVGQLVDERNNPLKATKGAAKLLAGNYAALKSWPLAITAYNHGQTGMKRAVKAVDSTDLDHIIRYYESPSFGFASKNFYAEFIAASSIYEGFKKSKNKENFHLSSVVLPNQWSVGRILNHLPISKDVLQEYNPCIKDAAYQNQTNRFLPNNFEIFLPNHLAYQVRSHLNKPTKRKRVAKRQ